MNNRLSSLFARHSTAAFPAEHKSCVHYRLACRMRMTLVIITGFVFLLQGVSAQEVIKADSISSPDNSPQKVTAQQVTKADSISIPKHSPHKATIYSMILPGLGQAYNRKYWKIPVIYAGFGVLAYFIHTNNKQYVDFKEAYQLSLIPDSLRIPNDNPLIERYKNSSDLPATLLSGQNYYRRNLEVSVMFTAVLYILNVVDAAVDAHFFDYNISDDLSLHVQPYLNPSPMATRQSGGLKITLAF